MEAMHYETANCKLNISKQCQQMESLPIERPLKPKGEITTLQDLVSELHQVFSSSYVNVEYVSQLMMNYKSDQRQWRKFAKFDRFRYTRNLVDAGNGLFNIMVLCWGPGHASAIHDHADSHCFMKMLKGELEEVRYEWPEHAKPAMLREKDICHKCDRPFKTDRKIGAKTENSKIHDCVDTVNFQSRDSGSNRIENQDGGDSCQKEVDVCQCQNFDRIKEEYDESDQMVELSRTRLEENDVCYINDTLGLHRVENPSHVEGAVSLHLYCPPFDSCRVFDARTGRGTVARPTFWSVGGKRLNKVEK